VRAFFPIFGSLTMLGSLIYMDVPWPYLTLLMGYLFWTTGDAQRKG
jgi:hypothetical protein